MIMVPYIVTAGISPLIGYLVDRLGNNRYFIMGNMGIFVIAQFIFLFYPQCTTEQDNGIVVGLIFVGKF